MTPPKAIIFDMDGTLIDSEPLHRATWFAAFDELGIPYPPGEEHALQGLRGEQVMEWLRRNAGEEAVDGVDPAELLRIKRKTYLERLDRGEVEAVAGADAFLRSLKGRFPLGIVTSAKLKGVGRVMLFFNWRNIFDALVGAEHVARHKPHPEPFLHVAARFKVDPSECLVFEDSRVGVEAARAAGCSVCGVATTLTKSQLLREGADWAISDFLDAATLERALAGERPRSVIGTVRRWFG